MASLFVGGLGVAFIRNVLGHYCMLGLMGLVFIFAVVAMIALLWKAE